MITGKILGIASNILDDNMRLKFFDAIAQYETNGTKQSVGDIIYDSLLYFCYEEMDMQNEIQNENNEIANEIKTKLNEIQNENKNIVLSKLYSHIQGFNIVSQNEIQNEIHPAQNEIQNEIRPVQNEIQNEITGNKNEIQNEIHPAQNEIKKRGCPKGTKKPTLIGNSFAKKRNSNEIQNEIHPAQNEITGNKNEILPAEIPFADVEVIENENENEFFIPLNDNEIKNDLENRKFAFGKKIGVFVDEYGKDMCRQFYEYWTECNEGGKKMRFEKEKTFEIKKRLARWFFNNCNNKFKNGTNQSNNFGNDRPKTSTSDEEFAKATRDFLNSKI